MSHDLDVSSYLQYVVKDSLACLRLQMSARQMINLKARCRTKWNYEMEYNKS